MGLLAIGLVLFLGAHAFVTLRGPRAAVIARIRRWRIRQIRRKRRRNDFAIFPSPPSFYRQPLDLAGALSVELGGHCYRELFRGTNRRPTIIAHPHLRAAIKFAVRSTSQRDGRLAEAAGGDAVVLAFPASHLLGMREALAPPGARLFRLSISIDHIKR